MATGGIEISGKKFPRQASVWTLPPAGHTLTQDRHHSAIAACDFSTPAMITQHITLFCSLELVFRARYVSAGKERIRSFHSNTLFCLDDNIVWLLPTAIMTAPVSKGLM